MKLKDVYNYDPETGIFTYLTKNNQHDIGDVAGSLHHTGYQRIYFDGRNYQDAILAWWYMTGEYESYMNRHDGDYKNCKFNNLIPSEQRVVMKGKRKPATKQELMSALDGSPLTIGRLAIKINQLPQNIRPKLNELVSSGYLIRSKYVYRYTMRGHCEQLSKGKFNNQTDRRSLQFQIALPGTLTASPPKSYLY